MIMATAIGIPVSDTVLWVEDTGEAELPPILCLHSLFLDGTMFDGLVRASKGRFRVVRPDFRGQARSAPATTPAVSMQTCADDMVALIEAVGLAPVHLVAASMGGDVAARMVARRPDLFRSMILLGSSVRGEPADQKAQFTRLLDETLDTGFVGANLEMMMTIMFGATTHANRENAAMLAHWQKRIEALPRSAWPAMYGVVARESAVPLLSKIKTPTLVMNGTEDIARPPEWAKEVTDNVSAGKLIMLEGAGHSPILEMPERVIPEVIGFMADIDQSAAAMPELKKGLLGRLFS